jgi:hypothetical protein
LVLLDFYLKKESEASAQKYGFKLYEPFGLRIFAPQRITAQGIVVT